MVQIISGEKGRGKTPYLLEKANEAVKTADGTIVFIDKNTKHMHDLDIKIRLINITQFPISSLDGFLGFVAGIISQDHDLEYLFLDSFLTIAHIDIKDSAPAFEVLEKLSAKYSVNFVVSVSAGKDELPEIARKNVVLSL